MAIQQWRKSNRINDRSASQVRCYRTLFNISANNTLKIYGFIIRSPRYPKHAYGSGKSSSKEKAIVKIPLFLAIGFESCVIIHSNICSFSHDFPIDIIHIIRFISIGRINVRVKAGDYWFYLRVSPDKFKSSLSKSACIFANLRMAENDSCIIANY